MNKCLIELRKSPPASEPLQFLEQRMPVYPRLAPLAQDLIGALASQAFVERIFPVCGLLTEGRRNCMTRSLEMRVFLHLKAHIIS